MDGFFEDGHGDGASRAVPVGPLFLRSTRDCRTDYRDEGIDGWPQAPLLNGHHTKRLFYHALEGIEVPLMPKNLVTVHVVLGQVAPAGTLRRQDNGTECFPLYVSCTNRE
jgi:hypothetical protein